MTPNILQNDRALEWTPHALQLLTEQIEEIHKKCGRPVVIAVCGGTASGKSTQVAQNLRDAIGERASLLHQDNFQNLPDRIRHLRPRYRGDDPENYGLSKIPNLLKTLKANQPVDIPNYIFRTRSHQGVRIVQPKPIVLFEGLYAAHHKIAKYCDFVIYVEMRALGRVLRRGYRGLFERYGRVNFANVFGNFCTSVMAAHMEFVIQQRTRADVIVRVLYTFSETLERFPIQPLIPAGDLPRPGPVIKEYTIDPETCLQLVGTNASIWMEVRFQHKAQLFFCFTAGPELSERILATDWNAF